MDGTVQEINRTVVETAAVKLSGSKPYIYFKVKSPLRIPVTDKKPFNISVFVKGLQPIKIQWQKDQHELVIGSRYKTFEDDDRRLLVESPFTEEDSGIYSASACNSKGCEVRGVQVMFNSKYLYGEIFKEMIDSVSVTQLANCYVFKGISVIRYINSWRFLSYQLKFRCISQLTSSAIS